MYTVDLASKVEGELQDGENNQRERSKTAPKG
jgi:hypothetical protein